MFARTVRVLATLAILTAATAGAATAAPKLEQIPAAFRGNDLFLKVSLNGAAPVWLKFDANANDSALTPGCLPGDSRSAARAAARMPVKLGAVALPAVFFDIAGAPASPHGLTVVGRLGRDSFGNRMLIVRPRQHQVWLSPPVDTGASPDAPLRTASLAP